MGPLAVSLQGIQAVWAVSPLRPLLVSLILFQTLLFPLKTFRFYRFIPADTDEAQGLLIMEPNGVSKFWAKFTKSVKLSTLRWG